MIEAPVPAADFPAAQDIAYLNTGTVGLIPWPVLEDSMCRYRDYQRSGPALPEPRERLRQARARAGEALAGLLRCARDEVELVVDTTAGINAAVAGLDLRAGDRVVVSDVEHYAGRVTWAYAAARRGLEIDVVPARAGRVETEDVLAALTPRTRVVSLSHVSFLSGARIDAPAMVHALRAHGVFSVLDAAQSVGVLDIEAGHLQWDLLAFPGYKWCLGPEGTGGMYLAPGAWDHLDPPAVSGGGMVERKLDGTFTLARGACRYAASNPSFIEGDLLAGSLEYLCAMGMARVQRHCDALVDRFLRGLDAIEGAFLSSPRDPGARSTLVVFGIRGCEPALVADRLYGMGVHLRTVEYGGGLRASFHVYNGSEDVDRLLEGVEHLARGGD